MPEQLGQPSSLGDKERWNNALLCRLEKIKRHLQEGHLYPLPRNDNTLDALCSSMYFSTLDLYSGYWQVEMDQRDIDKTAFVT